MVRALMYSKCLVVMLCNRIRNYHAGESSKDNEREGNNSPELYIGSETPSDDVVHECEHKELRDLRSR